MFARLKPYYGLLFLVKKQFIGAIVCAFIYALSSNAIPWALDSIIPRIFKDKPAVDIKEEVKYQKGRVLKIRVDLSQFPELNDANDSEIMARYDFDGSESVRLEKTIDAFTGQLPLPENMLGKELNVVLESSPDASFTGGRRIVIGVAQGYVVEDSSPWLLLGTVIILPIVFLLRSLSNFLNVYLTNYCGIRVLEEIRSNVFSKLQRLPLAFFSKQSQGDLISKTMSDTLMIQNTVVNSSNDLITQPLTFIGLIATLIGLSIKNDQLMFVFFCLIVIPACVLPVWYIGKQISRKAKAMQKELGVVTECVGENIGAAREVRAFTLEEKQIAGFKETVRGLFKLQLKVVKYTKILSPTIEFVCSIGVAAAIYYAAKEELDIKQVIPLLVTLQLAYDPFKKIGNTYSKLKKGIASLDRIEEILNEPETIKDAADAKPLGSIAQGITFKDVRFHYGETDVLRNINTELSAGKVYALVGPSGSGKSTFANLVMRFYDPVEGSVSIDGMDLRALQIKSLRDQIALVSQDPVLFNDTIYQNILLSNPNASEQDVYTAAERAFAHDFILGFDNGYETVVGNKGTRLSGGQKQRVAIARAFLKDAQIIILDEATSALDSESESRIQEALFDLAKGKTIIMIAHRFSTIKLADEIFVFDEGALTGQGTHEELIESNTTYKDLYEKQGLA